MQSVALLPPALCWGSGAAGGWRQPAQGGERHGLVLLRTTAGNGVLGEVLRAALAAPPCWCSEALQHRGHAKSLATGGRSRCWQGQAGSCSHEDAWGQPPAAGCRTGSCCRVQDRHPLQCAGWAPIAGCRTGSCSGVQDGLPLQPHEERDLSPWEHFVQEPGREAMLQAGAALGAVDVSLPDATPGLFAVQWMVLSSAKPKALRFGCPNISKTCISICTLPSPLTALG